METIRTLKNTPGKLKTSQNLMAQEREHGKCTYITASWLSAAPEKAENSRLQAPRAARPSMILELTAAARDAGSAPLQGELRRERELGARSDAEPGAGCRPGTYGALSAALATAWRCEAGSPVRPRPTGSPGAPHLQGP